MKKNIDYTIKTAREIYATYYPEPSFLVPGMIPLKGLTILAGPYKGGKSWFVLNLCLVLSRSGTFLNSMYLDAHTGLYLALEDSDSRLHYRMHSLGFEPTDNSLIATKFPSGLEGLKSLVKLLTENKKIEYVIVDTLGKFSNGRGKGNYQDDYDWVDSIKDIADKFSVSIMLTTHLRKLIDEKDDFNQISGTCGLMAVADSILILKKSRNSGDGTLSCTGRDFDEKKYNVYFSKETFCWSIKGDYSDSASTPERQSIFELLKDSAGEMTPQQISLQIDRNPKAVSNILAKLKDEGLVKKGSKYGTWIACSSTSSSTSSASIDIETSQEKGSYSPNQ